MKIYDDQLIVVTGGAGFIGSGVIRHLNEMGIDNLIVVDELGTSEKWKNLVGKRFVDILSKHQLFEWLKGKEQVIEAFIHLGACSSTVEKNASYLLENNYQYSVKLAEYALQNNQRFIYASSAATYGDGLQGFDDEHRTLHDLYPLNMYGYSKHLFDLWALQQGVLDQLVGLKYFNVFGPNEWHKERMASAIMHVVPTALKEGKIKLFKSSDPSHFPDGGQMRDFIYVKDVARMTCAFLENDSAGLFNIGSGVAETWNHLAQAIFKALNLPVNIEYIEMPKDLLGKYQNYTCAQMSKTKSVLGSVADCASLEDSVKDYIQNYLLPEKRW
ncbi:MAG: ADP-glyceromanno-heptose 6-epimerase [Parachlamydia sp.]|nr:MAG: ADP-glyceromanno-heptose 6-epimerase [Parachlamydia sp.]